MAELGALIGGVLRHMTLAQYVGLLSAGLGAGGTLFLFFGSYAFAPYQGAVFGGPLVNAANDRIRADNAARKVKQRIGLGMLCASFVAQAVAVVIAV